jgi:hypothetical protein
MQCPTNWAKNNTKWSILFVRGPNYASKRIYPHKITLLSYEQTSNERMSQVTF